jgi:hypothetical protein
MVREIRVVAKLEESARSDCEIPVSASEHGLQRKDREIPVPPRHLSQRGGKGYRGGNSRGN